MIHHGETQLRVIFCQSKQLQTNTKNRKEKKDRRQTTHETNVKYKSHNKTSLKYTRNVYYINRSFISKNRSIYRLFVC